jgi:hypothetical protein
LTKLYELKRGSFFKLSSPPDIPPDALSGDMTKLYKLNNLDGMYSNCVDMDKNMYHFAAWTEVENVEET